MSWLALARDALALVVPLFRPAPKPVPDTTYSTREANRRGAAEGAAANRESRMAGPPVEVTHDSMTKDGVYYVQVLIGSTKGFGVGTTYKRALARATYNAHDLRRRAAR